jgi:hypothetical protein
LVGLRAKTEQSVEALLRMKRQASDETMSNIQTSVRRGEIGLEAFKQLRNASATTLMIGATFISGGAATAVLGSGSILHGWARYQDSGKIGSALIEVAGNFFLGVMQLGISPGSLRAGASLKSIVGGGPIENLQGRVTMVIIGAVMNSGIEATKSMVEGQSTSQILRTTAVRFGVDLFTGGRGIRLDKAAMPVVVRLMKDSAVAHLGEHAVSNAGGGGAPAAAHKSTGPMPQPTSPVCDANSTLSTGACSAADWVDQLVLRIA